MAGQTAPEALAWAGRKRSWAALGAVLAALAALFAAPGGLGRLRGSIPGAEVGPFFGGHAEEAGKS